MSASLYWQRMWNHSSMDADDGSGVLAAETPKGSAVILAFSNLDDSLYMCNIKYIPVQTASIMPFKATGLGKITLLFQKGPLMPTSAYRGGRFFLPDLVRREVDIAAKIFSRLTCRDVENCAQACREWRDALDSEEVH